MILIWCDVADGFARARTPIPNRRIGSTAEATGTAIFQTSLIFSEVKPSSHLTDLIMPGSP